MPEIGEPSASRSAKAANQVAREKPRSKNDLHFAIRIYASYQSYGWTWEHEGKGLGYGETHDDADIRGDRATSIHAHDGVVYIIKDGELFKTYCPRPGGAYQEVKVTPSDVSGRALVGPERPYMLIEDYFPAGDEAGLPGEYHVLWSAIPLSRKRLFDGPEALVKKPAPRAHELRISRRQLRETDRDRRSGPEIFNDWQRGVGPVMNPRLYDLRRAPYGGADGLDLYLPDVFAECRRRAARYQQRLAEYKRWRDDERRNACAYLAVIVDDLRKKEKHRARYVNQERLDEWIANDADEFRRGAYRVSYAARSLVHWLRSPWFKEVQRDFDLGTEEQQGIALAVYEEATRRLDESQEGAEYLQKEYDDPRSYFQCVTRVRAVVSGGKGQDPDAPGNWFTAAREGKNEVFGLMENWLGPLLKEQKEQALNSIQRLNQAHLGVEVATAETRILERSAAKVTLFDWRASSFLEKVAKFPKTPGGRGITTFFDAVNVCLSFQALVQADSAEGRIKSGADLLGDALDFVSSNWLFEAYVTKIGWGGAIPAMGFASGMIDSFIGYSNAATAGMEGDYPVAIGWAIVGMGGYLTAIGAATLEADGIGAPIFLVGLLLMGIGRVTVAWTNSDELENWMKHSIFGKALDGQSSPQEDIRKLNDILFKFDVEGRFTQAPTTPRGEHPTIFTLRITPRVLTERSTVTLSNVKGYAEQRWWEALSPSSDTDDLREGPVPHEWIYDVDLDHFTMNREARSSASADRLSVDRDDKGRITEVRIMVTFPRETERVTGTVRLNPRAPMLPGWSRNFEAKA